MDEEDWLDCNDPRDMLAGVRSRASERQLRLFAVACCRSVGPAKPWPEWTHAVDSAEQFADGLIDPSALYQARVALERAMRDWVGSRDFGRDAASWSACHHDIRSQVANAAGLAAGRHPEQEPIQAELLRCLFGPPFFHDFFVPADLPAWRTSDVLRLASGIYDERAFDRMPILGDALEDAGCSDDSALGHCRKASRHTRGCWVVDLLLGRS